MADYRSIWTTLLGLLKPTALSPSNSISAAAAQSSRAPHSSRQHRVLSIVEIALVVVVLLAQLWEVWRWVPVAASHDRLARVLLSVTVVGVLAASLVRAPIDLVRLGLSPSRWRRGWLSLAICSVAALLGIALIAYVWGHPWRRGPHWGWTAGYVGGAIVQQLCLQSFVNNRLFELSRGSTAQRARTAVVGSSLLFGLMHAPNPGLVLVSILAAGFWTWHFRRWSNLPSLIASHAALGITLRISIGDGLLLHMRVGWGATRKLLGL